MHLTKHLAFGVTFLLCSLTNTITIAQMEWQPTNYTQDTKINDFLSWGNTLYAATYNQGISKTEDGGQTWQTLNEGLTDLNVQALVRKGERLFAGTFHSGVFTSIDRGQSWQSVTNDTLVSPQIWTLLVNNNRVFAGTRWGIYYSDDEGTNWQHANLPQPKAHHRIIYCMEGNGTKIIAGTSRYVYESADNGDSWTQYKVPTDYGVFTAVDYQGDILLGTGGDGVLYPTTGSGYSATPPITNNAELGISISTLHSNGINLLSSVEGAGVFMDAIPINEGLEQAKTSQLITHQGRLYAGTYNHGIWKYELIPPPELQNLVTDKDNQPLQWTDLSVYPNPLGSHQEMVQLHYHVPKDGLIKLELYHETGKHIATLANSFEPKGNYQLTFDMSTLQNGNYYFAFFMDKSVIAQPVFLIR